MSHKELKSVKVRDQRAEGIVGTIKSWKPQACVKASAAALLYTMGYVKRKGPC